MEQRIENPQKTRTEFVETRRFGGAPLAACVKSVFVSDKATPGVLAKLNHNGLRSAELRIRQS